MSNEQHKAAFDVEALAQRLARQRAISFDDIERLLAALEAEREQRIQERADMLALLRWVCDCWPGRFRPDAPDCTAPIREFLATLAPAPAEGK